MALTRREGVRPARARLIVVALLAGLAALLLLARAPVPAARADEPPDPLFSMDTQFVQAGQTFTVPVQFGTNVAMRLARFDLAYSPAILRVNSVQAGSFLTSFAAQVGAQVIFNPGTIDNVNGSVNGIMLGLSGAPGQGALGGGPIAVISFTALANGRSTTLVNNPFVGDVNGGQIPGILVTGGQIYVGPLPQLTVSSLSLTPTGTGANFGMSFDVQFQVSNIGGSASDPAVATIGVDGGAPGFLTRTVPSLAPNVSQTFVITGFQLLAAQAGVSVGVSGDGTRVANYMFHLITSTGNSPVDASFGAYLLITPASLINFGTMSLGQNTAQGPLNVKCNAGYAVDVYDNNPTAWHMTEWNGSAFLSQRLGDSLHVQYPPQGTDVTAGSPARLLTGTQAGQATDDGGQDFNLTFTQGLHYADPLLPAGESYHLILTFNSYVVL
jgi:hypothetical protein